jgi:cytochrome c oxidase cbb3-type subunit 3
MKKIIALFVLMISGLASVEAAEIPEQPFKQLFNDPLAVALVVVVIMLLVTIFALLRAVSSLVRFAEEKAGIAREEEQTGIERLMQSLTRSTPVEKEQDIMLSHDYDGIKELDNSLPPWWLYGFYISIVFAFIYMGYYHMMGGPGQAEKYEREMARAELAIEEYKANAPDLVDENNVFAMTDEADLLAGEEIFQLNCAACHLADGGGSVGPNLTDEYWVHGGSITDIFSTIKYGVPAKGMISWESSLRATEMQQVASYILTLQGTTPANPKAPEGELYVPEPPAPDSTAVVEEVADESAENVTEDTGEEATLE